MAGQIIDGKKIAGEIKQEIAKEILELKEKRGKQPKLVVVLVGKDPASEIYVKAKGKSCEECGIEHENIALDENVSEKELLELIEKLNNDTSVHGILVQLPLPKQINANNIMLAINPQKDVDGFHPQNFGRLLIGEECFEPCTPKGVIELLKRLGEEIEGKEVTVVGYGRIVGRPLSAMLSNSGATVTVCNSKTKDLAKHCRNADILMSAVGKPGLITKEMVKKEAIVIDIGINRLENGKVVGDVDFEQVKDIVKAITPVPGCVGPMTVAMLMDNTLIAFKKLEGIQ